MKSKQQSEVIQLMESGVDSNDAIKQVYGKRDNLDKVRKSKAIREARERLAEQAKKMTGLTREDIIDGMLKAVTVAEAKEAPAAMISAWREVGKLIDAYPAAKIKMEHSGTQQVQHLIATGGSLDQLPTAALLEASGMSPIDLTPEDFREIEEAAQPALIQKQKDAS